MLWLKSFFSKQDDFKKAFALSAVLHFLIVAFFMVKLLLFSKPLIDLSKAISVNIGSIQSNNKLPEKREDPAPAPVEKEPAKELPAKPIAAAKPEPNPKKVKEIKEEINLNKTKTTQKQALDKIKKMSALDKIKQEVADESVKNPKAKAKKTAKSNIVPAGSQMAGLDKIEASDYLQKLDASIKQSWTLPQWLVSKNFRAQVLVKFNTLGQIISTKILASSGNSTYDNYCIQAITKSAPFPKVPEKFSEKFSVDGLIVGFPE